LDLDHPAPVVLFFHGLHSVAITRSTTHFDETADKNQFIAVYPVGIGSSWNAGDCCGIAVEDKVDEITFVRQILSDLGTIANIDPKRIYATGSYNGGMISYRLACEMSDTLAAIAPVTGTQVFGECQPEQPVSILHIHGLSDPYVPYRGGSSLEGSIADLPSVEQGIETWSRLNECTDSPEVKVEGAVTHTSYTCQAGTAIELYILEGLEGWPLKFPTNQTIWDFFAAHPKS
jgi:polyhydroxybutyrate depolymerase